MKRCWDCWLMLLSAKRHLEELANFNWLLVRFKSRVFTGIRYYSYCEYTVLICCRLNFRGFGAMKLSCWL